MKQLVVFLNKVAVQIIDTCSKTQYSWTHLFFHFTSELIWEHQEWALADDMMIVALELFTDASCMQDAVSPSEETREYLQLSQECIDLLS